MKEALKLALEALEVAKQHIWLGDKAGVDANIKAHQTIVFIKEALAQPEQEPVAWNPDRSGKYLTVVYRDVTPGDEVGAIVDHPKCVIMSWSNAVHDVEQLKNPPQRTWVGLTPRERADCWETIPELAMRKVEAKLKEKNT